MTRQWVARAVMSVLMSYAAAVSAQSVEVPAGQQVVLTAEGRGVQIYRCMRQENAEPKWIFVAPEAQLYVNGALSGTHGAGPMWSYKDGSSVRGKLLATKPSPEAGAVPWLLLEARDAAGPGVLGRVSYIRRMETKGGQVNEAGCDEVHVGTTSRVPYTATYTFYAPVK